MGINRVICPFIKAINRTNAPYIARKVDVGSILQPSFSIEKINKSLCDALKIGSGTEAKIYKILDTNYVIRVPNSKKFINDSAKINFNISAQDRINHCIATVDDCQIQKYIEGCNPRGYIERSYRTGTIFEQNIEKNREIKNCILEKLSEDKMKRYYLQLAVCATIILERTLY